MKTRLLAVFAIVIMVLASLPIPQAQSHQPTTKLSSNHVISYKCDICHRSEDFVEVSEHEHNCTGTTEKKHASHRMHKYAEKDVAKKLD